MVSLAVLGLIAGLTVPSVVNVVRTASNKAKLKEAYQIVSAIMAESVMNGDWASMTGFDTATSNAGDVTEYFKSKLNYAKQCVASDTTSAGCTSDSGGNFRFIMPNGVKITILNLGHGWWAPTHGYWSFNLKADAYSSYVGAWNVNPTEVGLYCNITQVTGSIFSNYSSVRPGQCVGWGSTAPTALALILS